EAKQWLLNSSTRQMYNSQLRLENPDLETSEYKPDYLGIFFEIDDQATMLRQLKNAAKDLKNTNEILGKRISQLRSEEKIYKFPVRDRELLDINYQLFTKHFVNEAAKTIYFSMLQVLARHKKPVRYLLYTESNGYSYIRYYEYIILKFKIEGRKRYILSRATPEYLKSKGIEQVEPSIHDDGSMYRSRLQISIKNPMFVEEAGIDHIIEEVLELYDNAIESIETFNESVLRVKQQQVERFLADKAIKKAMEEEKKKKKVVQEEESEDE
ncbi:MAG: hypothetical protein IJR44_00715, partial [Neisseriaceae bacterium]|nr:hypothetical protein [Neisseriaceae bacterium]